MAHHVKVTHLSSSLVSIEQGLARAWPPEGEKSYCVVLPPPTPWELPPTEASFKGFQRNRDTHRRTRPVLPFGKKALSCVSLYILFVDPFSHYRSFWIQFQVCPFSPSLLPNPPKPRLAARMPHPVAFAAVSCQNEKQQDIKGSESVPAHMTPWSLTITSGFFEGGRNSGLGTKVAQWVQVSNLYTKEGVPDVDKSKNCRVKQLSVMEGINWFEILIQKNLFSRYHVISIPTANLWKDMYRSTW